MRLLVLLLALGLPWMANASVPTWRGVEIQKLVQSPSAPDTIYAIGNNGVLFRSDNRGLAWLPLRTPGSVEYADLHVDSRNARHILVLKRGRNNEEKPRLLETFDSGQTWAQQAPLRFLEPDGSPGGRFFPVRLSVTSGHEAAIWWAYDGRSFRSTDGGQTWVRQQEVHHEATMSTPSQSLSYRLNGTILWRSDDAGQSWVKAHEFEIPSNPRQRTRNPSNLLALNDDELVVRDNKGNWLQSNDRGVNWALATNGFQNLNQQQPAVRDSAPNPQFFGGETWCSVQRSPAAATVLLASCVWDNGAHPSATCFHVSKDAGRSWTPPRSAGSISGSGCQAQGLPRGWNPTALLLDAVNPLRLLVAWQAGGMFRSDDGGQTWEASDSGLMFRNIPETGIDWMAVGEPPLIQAVLYRDHELLRRTLASGVNINASGNTLGGVLDADIAALTREVQEQDTAGPLMWPELRAAGATSVASPSPGTGLITRAFKLKRGDIADDLVQLGYDWGVRPSFVPHEFARQGELDDLLRKDMPLTLSPLQVQRLITAYIKAAHFPSADQTTLDLLNNDYPDLAVKVLQASSKTIPFDRQTTPLNTHPMWIGAGLLAAGKKAAARQLFAATSFKGVDSDPLPAHYFFNALEASCDLREARWYKEKGLFFNLRVYFGHCLSDKKLNKQARVRLLHAMNDDGGIPAENWGVWLKDEDKQWLRYTALYRKAFPDKGSAGNGLNQKQ